MSWCLKVEGKKFLVLNKSKKNQLGKCDYLQERISQQVQRKARKMMRGETKQNKTDCRTEWVGCVGTCIEK